MTTCPHCGYESAGVEICPLCSTPLGGSGREVGGRSSADTAGASSPAWEDVGVPFPRNLALTWRDSVLEPSRFFRSVPYEAPAHRPLLYFLIVSVVAAMFTLWWQALGLELGSLFGGAADEIRGPSALVEFFMSPFAALLGVLLWSLILQLFALMIIPTHRGLGATLRVLCYSAGPSAFTLVPYVGALVGGVWVLVIQIIGMREAHRTTGGRAAATVLGPITLLVLLVVFLAAIAWSSAGGLLLQDLPR